MDNTNLSLPANSYLNATGAIDYGMTNDYMFRAVLQKNVRVLKGLICSLLHLDPIEVESVEITNPIELGDDIDDKTFVLDINILMNDNTLINLEMQMNNLDNWPERSLSYLCRTFDQLYRGETYKQAKPAIHIGFLNFTPFPKYPEFYATFKMLNEKNHICYSDKFILSVVDLTHIELATDDDKANQLDYWARLFTATSWEEIRMLTENNTNLAEASQTLYELNADEITRRKCQARRDYYRHEKNMQEKIAVLEDENAVLTARIAELEQGAKGNARKLFENGISYELVRASTDILSDEELQEIYNEVVATIV